jgi:uncharacterized protein (TIGR03083 family)
MTSSFNNADGSKLAPILCAPLLRKVDAALIHLLRSLEPAEWDLPTIAPLWKVRDVAAHLLDTALRKLSLVRDGCFVEAVEIRSRQDLVDFINRINREGVTIYRRLSPAVLGSLMETVCAQYADVHEGLDPFAPAAFSVSWAGEDASLNWFDTARELTERWHHQQQIRLATHRTGIMTPELYHPVLDCFLRGLPHHYRDVDAAVGTGIEVEIAGECGGRWFLIREPTGWALVKTLAAEPAAHVTIPQELAWRLFTKGIDRSAARAAIEMEGNSELAEKVLQLTAIVG